MFTIERTRFLEYAPSLTSASLLPTEIALIAHTHAHTHTHIHRQKASAWSKQINKQTKQANKEARKTKHDSIAHCFYAAKDALNWGLFLFGPGLDGKFSFFQGFRSFCLPMDHGPWGSIWHPIDQHRARFMSHEWCLPLTYQDSEEGLLTLTTRHGSSSRIIQVTPFHRKG